MALAHQLDRRDVDTAPILTAAQVAALTGARPASIARWSRGDKPMVHRVPTNRGWPSFSFLGLLETQVALVLSELFSAQRARHIMAQLKQQRGHDYAAGGLKIVTDSSHTFLQEHDDLERIGDHQGTFLTVIEDHLKPLRLGADGRVEQFEPTWFPDSSVNPRFNGGNLSLSRNRVPLAAVAGLLIAGETPASVANEYQLSKDEVEQVDYHLGLVVAATGLEK